MLKKKQPRKSQFWRGLSIWTVLVATTWGWIPAAAQAPAPEARTLLTLVVNATLGPCHSSQPSLPPEGRWAFVLNFNTNAPLQGCLIDRTVPGQTKTTIVPCIVNDPQKVMFDAEGVRRFAMFDGGGAVLCPNFDPPGQNGVLREFKNMTAVARPAQTLSPRANPLLVHPAANGSADLAYRMPVSGASVGLATQIGVTRSYTTPSGAQLGEWNVLYSEMTRQAPYVLTHTINAGSAVTFTPGVLLFNANAVTLTIGFDPARGDGFLGAIDEIILDPRSSVGG
jgi:hypothetical protein